MKELLLPAKKASPVPTNPTNAAPKLRKLSPALKRKKEEKLLNGFNNVTRMLTSTTPEFLETIVEDILKQDLTIETKTVIREKATQILGEAETNPKIRLPETWEKLTLLT